MNFDDWAREEMPPPPPRPPKRARAEHPTPPETEASLSAVADSLESESGSVFEHSLRAAEAHAARSLSRSHRAGAAGGDSSSARRRRRRRKRTASDTTSMSLPVSAYVRSVGEDRERRGVFRSDVSLGGGGGGASQSLGRAASLRRALADASVPNELANRVLEHSLDDHALPRRHAVPAGELYDPDACPICEETLTFVHADVHESLSVRSDAATQTAATRRDKRARARAARLAVAREDTQRHELIFKLAEVLATRIPDARLVRHLLVLRRNLIEADLERYGIPYVAWTHDMLARHFDPANHHRFDPAREALADHRALRAEIDKMRRSMYVPSQTNPGVTLVDTRVADQVLKWTLAMQKTRKHIQELQLDVDPNASASLRAMADAVGAFRRDRAAEQLTLDPELEAGTLAMGGDARTTAGTAQRRAVGTAARELTINGL